VSPWPRRVLGTHGRMDAAGMGLMLGRGRAAVLPRHPGPAWGNLLSQDAPLRQRGKKGAWLCLTATLIHTGPSENKQKKAPSLRLIWGRWARADSATLVNQTLAPLEGSPAEDHQAQRPPPLSPAQTTRG